MLMRSAVTVTSLCGPVPLSATIVAPSPRTLPVSATSKTWPSRSAEPVACSSPLCPASANTLPSAASIAICAPRMTPAFSAVPPLPN